MARSALGPVAFRPTSPLVGRGTEREAIERALARSRVVTLIGPPGAGKTRLATEVATSRPGAVICGLAAARTRSEVLAEVVHALGLSAQAPEGEVRAASSACPLVVLDNCEQALDAVRAVVDDWRDTRLLLTSRVAMDHAGEELVPVAGLDEEAAVALFLARARVVSPGFDPNAVQLRAVRELVDGLDRLPLGIEMAAARVRVLSPTAIVDRLGAQLDLLRGDETGWGTLRAAIAWSWELLPASHRSALAQSTVFVGGFDLAAAEAVLEVPGGDAVVDVLDDLERASLLMTVEVPALDGELRFRHYVAVRQFAAGYRPQGVEARLAAHYQDRFGDVWRNRRDEPARRTLVELRIEVANLVAVREAVRADADLALATTLVAGLGSRPEDAERMIGESVVRARDDRLRLVALQHQSALRHHLGLDAWEPVTEALAVARSLGDADSEADVLGKMALFAKAEGRFDETERLFGEAIRVAEAAGATRSLAAALDGLGNHQASRYRFAEAEQTLVRAVALAEGAGPLLFAWSLLDLGQVRRLQGRLGEADALHRQALAVSAMAGFATEARAHSMCGTLWLQMGRFDEATAAVTRAAEIHRAMGRPVREANNLRSLAHIALVTGDLASAEALVRRAIERHRGVVLELRSDQVVLWGALLHAGRRAEAQACIELLATECEAADDRRTEAYARVGASIQQGPDEAGAGLRRAEALGASPALLAIGRAWRAHLDGDEAAVEQILAAVGPTAPGEEEWVLRALLDRERAGPELRLVARYESVHLQRPGQPVLVVTGNAARLLTELVQLAAPAPWELVARQVWGTEIDEQSLRRRWDTTLSRLRQRLEAAGVRRTLVNTDHRGNVELVLGPGELAIDES